MKNIKKIAKEILTNEISFKEELTNSYSGQKDLTLFAYLDNKIVGKLEYVEYQGSISVSIINVKPEFRRMGIGKKLILELQKQNPRTEIELGLQVSPEGTALVNSLKSQLYIDQKKRNKEKLLQSLIIKRDKVQKQFDSLYKNMEKITDETELNKIRKQIKDLDKLYNINDINDKIYDLEKELL